MRPVARKRPQPSTVARTTLRLPPEVVSGIDRVVEKECFRSRTALVEYLVQRYERERDARPHSRTRQRTLPLTVGVSLPKDAQAVVRRRGALDKNDLGETEVLLSALWHMRESQMSVAERREELERGILQGINSGPGRLVTPNFWRDLRAGAREHTKRVSAARARGELANLSLPRELFEFVTAEVLSGRHETPTAVVCAALHLSERQAWRHEKAWNKTVKQQEELLAEASRHRWVAPRKARL